jgi:hypothetical protein
MCGSNGERDPRVVDQNNGRRETRQLPRGDRDRRTARYRLRSELVPVVAESRDAEEGVAGLDRA